MAPTPDAALKILLPRALDGVLPARLPALEAHAGVPLVVAWDLNPAIPRRILAGEPFGLAITNPGYVADLVARGLVAAADHRPFGRAALAIAGRDAAPGGAETSHAGIATLLRAAGTIAFTAEGTSGRMFLAALEALGIAAEIAPRLVPMHGGQSPSRAAAAGDVALAIAPMTTAVSVPGLQVLGAFPADLGTDIEMSVFLSTACADHAPARRALDWFTDPALDQVLAEHGLTRFAFPSPA